MKRTQRKDAIRNIRKQVVSYLSIAIIAMLAVLAYLGVNFGALAVGAAGDKFFRENNFRDLHVMSTYMLTPGDIEAIRQVEGVLDVEGVYRTEAKVRAGNDVLDVFVMSLTERINTVQLVEGRLPENPNECVVELEMRNTHHIGIGDQISAVNSDGGMPSYLTNNEYTVTGVVIHPDHACFTRYVPGKLYILVQPQVFDSEALENCFMTAEIQVDGTSDLYRMDEGYIDAVDPVFTRLEALADERAVIRYNEIRSRYQDQIDEGQAQLDDAQGQLSDARNELDVNWDSYFDGLDEIERTTQELRDARDQLVAGWDELEAARLQIEDGERQLAQAKVQLDEGWAQLVEARLQLDAARVALETGEQSLIEARAALDAFKVQLDNANEQLQNGSGQLDNAAALLEAGRQQLITGFELMEDVKEILRYGLYTAIEHTLGQQTADAIPWSPRQTSIDVNDPNAGISIINITQNTSFDFSKSFTQNLVTLLTAIGVSDPQAAAQAITEYTDILESGYNSLASIFGYWDQAHQMYLNGLALYNSGLATYEDKLQLYNYALAQYQAGEAQYAESSAMLEQKRAEYEEGEAQYAAGLAEYEARRAQYEEAEAQLADARARYNAGLAEYEAGRAQVEEGEIAVASGQTELSQAYIALQSGEAEYSDGLAQFNESSDQLNQAIEDMQLLDDCHWVVLDAYGNGSYLFIRSNAESISNLGMTFASIFIVVGALVILATVGRIIDEQRRLVGATKAFGFFNREILSKYLTFGVTGTLIGMIAGAIGGYFIVQRIVINTYSQFYVYGVPAPQFDTPMTVSIIIAGVILSAITVWFACRTLLKEPAVKLMNDLVPFTKKKARTGKNSRRTGGLYARMIVLNMLADKKRVIVTIVSIAGSCALLVTGLTMNASIKKSINAEFDDIVVYDYEIIYDPTISETAEEEIEQELIELGVEYVPVLDFMQPYDANGRLSTCELICGDVNELNNFIVRRDRRSNVPITGYTEGIWIYQKLSDSAEIAQDEYITLYDSAMNPNHVTVTGVFRNYIGLYTIMSEEEYTALFEHEPVHNAFLIKLNGVNGSVLTDSVKGIHGYKEMSSTSERRNNSMALVSVLDVISLMFIVIAAMMDYFVLLNLVNMYINQKTRELTIMRINGFTVGETIRYVSLELVVSTILGILLGWAAGIGLAYRVISVLEPNDIYFTKSIQFGAIGIASLISIVFTAAVAAWALRKVKHLKLTDLE